MSQWPYTQLLQAAKELDALDKEPRYLRVRATYEKRPSVIWKRYMEAYWNWIEATRRIDSASPHTNATLSGVLKKGGAHFSGH